MSENEALGPGIEFTETMRGFLSLGTINDYKSGFERGKQDDSPFEFTVTVTVDDVERMIQDPDHTARMSGSVRAPKVSPDPLTVSAGRFHLLVRDPDAPLTRKMIYRLTLRSSDGKNYYMEGFKLIHDDRGLDVWSDTTTLYVDLYEGSDSSGALLGKGIVHIHLNDFRRQLLGMKAINTSSKLDGVRALAKFGRFFSGALSEIFGGPLSPVDATHDSPTRQHRTLRLPTPEVYPFDATDGVRLQLTRYKGGTKGPVLVSPGFGTPAASFTIDTNETNFAEYLVERGYDVWLFDYRASPALESSMTQFSLDDIATKDFPAAVQTVRELTSSDTVQVMAHCLSSGAFLMSLAAGLQGVRSGVASQVSLHLRVAPLNRARSALRVGNVLSHLGVDKIDTETSENPGWAERLFDQAIRLYPSGRERCNSPVCRRIMFLYGEVYDHDQLNDATHETLHEIFGVANLTTLDHVGVIVNHGHMVTMGGDEAYIPHLDRLKLPLAFIHGEQNRLFLPVGSELTRNALSEVNGADYYTRHVIPGYAHLDCFIGKNAATDVFPIVTAELDRHN
jgi:choline dehydrogenase-like flavoprotein